MARLLKILTLPDIEAFRRWHTLALNNILEKKELRRIDFWTKAFAVGDEDWLKEKLATAGIKRMKVKSMDGILFAIGGND